MRPWIMPFGCAITGSAASYFSLSVALPSAVILNYTGVSVTPVVGGERPGLVLYGYLFAVGACGSGFLVFRGTGIHGGGEKGGRLV